MPTFHDESTDCAICLEPLEESQSGDDESTLPRRVLTLQCGHKWHYDCLVQQLQTAQSMTTSRGSSQRIIFTGCQCAKCGQICEHKDLDHLTRATDALRVKVDALLEEQLQLDAPHLWKKAIEEEKDNNNDQTTSSRDMLLKEARRKYAFYLCSHCEEPYFGGTIECADEFALEGSSDHPPEQRFCTGCAPQSQVVCRNPQEHGGFLIWKCRYCCQPSTHVCYGNIHFCDDCHKRNSSRVREIQQQQREQGIGRNHMVKPPQLEPIRCPGASCCFPKPSRDVVYHLNGPSPKDCEQVYSCAFCESNDERGLLFVEPGSQNLLVNPSGERGLLGWQQLNRRISWAVEESELPVNATTNTNFVSSFMDCVMVQEVNLSQLLQAPRQWQVPLRLEVSARYMGRTDCPSVFQMQAVLFLGRNRNHVATAPSSGTVPVLLRETTPILDAPPDYWESARLELMVEPSQLPQEFSPGCSLTLHVVIIGKDRRFWQGRFGSKVAEISARILGTSAVLDAAILPAARREILMGENDGDRAPHLYHRRITGQPRQQPSHGLGQRQDMSTETTESSQVNIQNNARKRMLWDVLLPAIFFALLAWLAMDGGKYNSIPQR
jgi:F-box associated region